MHFAEPLYRNPYIPPYPLLEITRGCSYNKTCKFCNLHYGETFSANSFEWIEEDLREIASYAPDTTHLQLVGANPICLPFEHLDRFCDLVHEVLPGVVYMHTGGRVTDLRNKTVEQLKILREKGMTEFVIGTESGDDWTLDRIDKGYHGDEIVEACHKLDEAGIRYWITYINGVAGKSHWREHAINSAKIFSQINPMVITASGLILFPETALYQEAQRGEFDPLDERTMMEEMLLFVENLECDPERFITHFTMSTNLMGSGTFQQIKPKMIEKLRYDMEHMDLEARAERRKHTMHI